MKLLTGFATEQEAKDKSHAWFLPHAHPTSETYYLVGWKQHPETEQWALCVPPDYEELLPAEDRELLVDDWTTDPS